MNRLFVVVAVVSVGFLTACGTSPPPADELAHETVDAARGPDGEPLSDAVRECMHARVDEFELTETERQGFDNLDDVFNKAAEGQEQALTIVDRFQADLETCN